MNSNDFQYIVGKRNDQLITKDSLVRNNTEHYSEDLYNAYYEKIYFRSSL